MWRSHPEKALDFECLDMTTNGPSALAPVKVNGAVYVLDTGSLPHVGGDIIGFCQCKSKEHQNK